MIDKTIKNSLSRDQYHDIDYQIMALAFDIHNRMGRFHSECVYRNELAYLAEQAGFQAKTEVPLTITHGNFSKTYYQDLVINDAITYELKTRNSLTARDHAQLINYLFLAQRNHGKLINFGSTSVEDEFVTTAIPEQDRKTFTFNFAQWNSTSAEATLFLDLLKPLLEDWGLKLDTDLYTEAATFFLGGEEKVLKPIPIKSGNRTIGTKKVHLIGSNQAFKITTTKHAAQMQTHLLKFLAHTDLEAILWINLTQKTAHFKTLTQKESSCP